MFIGSGETIIREPLAELYPRLVPELGEMARGLTGSAAPVSIARAREILGWTPKYSWRNNAML